MENTTRISFSAITHIGAAGISNDVRIYANGRFLQAPEADCSKTSLEAAGRHFLFALSDGMDSEAAGISVTGDLKKLQEKMKNSSKEIMVKLDELANCIEQSNNLLYSVSLGEEAEKPKKAAFAGIVVDDGSIAAVNMGNSRIYRLDGDNFKLMVNDYKRTDRLLKMGIISDEQAEMLSSRLKTTASDGKTSVRKSEVHALRQGSLFLACSKGLTEAVNEDTIYDILASGAETDVIADTLVKEAIQNEAADNVAVMVLRVDEAGDEAPQVSNVRSLSSGNISGKINRLTRNVKKRRLDIARFATTLVAFVVVAAVVFGLFTLWLNFRNLKGKEAVGGNIDKTTPTTASTTAPGLDSESGDATGTLDTSAEGDTGADVQSGEGDAGTAAAGTTYKVKPGDSLMKISEKIYGDKSKYKLIMEANNITNPNKITVDQILKIPPAGEGN